MRKTCFYWPPRHDKRHHLTTLRGAKCDHIPHPPLRTLSGSCFLSASVFFILSVHLFIHRNSNKHWGWEFVWRFDVNLLLECIIHRITPAFVSAQNCEKLYSSLTLCPRKYKFCWSDGCVLKTNLGHPKHLSAVLSWTFTCVTRTKVAFSKTSAVLVNTVWFIMSHVITEDDTRVKPNSIFQGIFSGVVH